MQSLIEQVKRLAEAQKKWGTTSCFILDANMNARFNVDFPAILAELERKDAALKEVLVGDSNISAWGRRIIDAALQPKEPPCKA